MTYGRLRLKDEGGRRKGERGIRKTCLRTFEPANDRRDAARRDGGPAL